MNLRTGDFHAHARAEAAADGHLRSSELCWTILGSTTLILDKPTGTIELAPPHDSAEKTVPEGNAAPSTQAALKMDETIDRTLE